MKKDQKNQNQALEDSNLANVSGGLSQDDIKMLYGAGFKLQVSQSHYPEVKAGNKVIPGTGYVDWSGWAARNGTSYSWTNGKTTFSNAEIGQVLDIMKQNP